MFMIQATVVNVVELFILCCWHFGKLSWGFSVGITFSLILYLFGSKRVGFMHAPASLINIRLGWKSLPINHRLFCRRSQWRGK